MEVRDIYQFSDNTYILAKSEINLETEIGDIKQPEKFYPQVKIKKWDNESNFSMRLSYSFDNAIITEDEKSIVWTSGDKKYQVKFYDVDIENDSCYEMEVIINEKPETNKIKFTITNKELQWFFQPELTKEEIDMGCERPENVVNSYAVYHASKQNGHYYKNGKAFHYYRPRIMDSKGSSCWGDIELDLDNSLLYVVIPEYFYNEAQYPIYHAAGATFGFTTPGASNYRPANDYGMGTKIGPPAAGTEKVTSMSLYLVAISGIIRNCKGALYTFAANANTSYKVTNGVTPVIGVPLLSPVAASWYTSNFDNPYSISLCGDDTNKYYFGMFINETNLVLYIYYDSSGAAGDGCIQAMNYATPPSSVTIANGVASTWKLAIYVTYDAPVARAVPGAVGTNFNNPGII